MRILFVHNINQVAATFAENLRQRGHCVKIYEPDLAGAAAPLPLKLALIPKRLFNLRDVVGSLNRDHYDLVHIHWASYGMLGLLSHIPFVVHCHGSDVRNRLKHPLFRRLLEPFLKRAAAVLCITPDLLPIVRALRPDALLSPAPIDTLRFAPAQDNFDEPSHSWTILLFARLDPDKGIAIAMEGLVRFVQRHAGIRLQLLDWGPLRKEFHQRYEERVEFLSLVAPDEVERIILAADVIVGQFAFGALGLSELQAMSCAKPVIASFLYAEAYSTPPPICQASTAAEIDEQLEQLYQRPEFARELGWRAREWVINNHSSQSLTIRLEEVYQSILLEKK